MLLYIRFLLYHFSNPHIRYDVRGKAHTDARHWSDDKTLAGRAFFRGDQRPARLVLDNIRDTDRAVYKCRVDYDRAPTKIFNVALDIIGEDTNANELEAFLIFILCTERVNSSVSSWKFLVQFYY